MFRLIVYKVTGFVIPNFGHFISKTMNFVDFVKICL